MDEVYSLAQILESFVAFDKLTLKSVPFTDEEMEKYIKKYPSSGEARLYRQDKKQRLLHGRTSKPSKISKEKWVEDRVKCLEDMRSQ